MSEYIVPIKMRPETADLIQAFDDLSSNFSKVNNLSSTINKKDTVLSQIEKLLKIAREYKSRVQSSNSLSKCANRILSIEMCLKAWKETIQFWKGLRSEQWESAWEKLVDAEMSALRSIQADVLGYKLESEKLYKKLTVLEKLLFPKQLFSSLGMRTGTGICQICEKDYTNCDHIKGKAYNGEFCFVEITEISEIDHLALVDDPANKHLRITSLE